MCSPFVAKLGSMSWRLKMQSPSAARQATEAAADLLLSCRQKMEGNPSPFTHHCRSSQPHGGPVLLRHPKTSRTFLLAGFPFLYHSIRPPPLLTEYSSVFELAGTGRREEAEGPGGGSAAGRTQAQGWCSSHPLILACSVLGLFDCSLSHCLLDAGSRNTSGSRVLRASEGDPRRERRRYARHVRVCHRRAVTAAAAHVAAGCAALGPQDVPAPSGDAGPRNQGVSRGAPP